MTTLDDRRVTAKLDPGDMLQQVRSLPAQLAGAARVRDALGQAFGNTRLPLDGVREAVVCGMGGSAIGGDFTALWAANAGVRVSVWRGYGLPSWVENRHLLLFSSYSGNTEETLSAYAASANTSVARVCVTTGGQLAAWARRDGVPLVTLPAGLQPRAALGHSLVAQLVVLHAAGLLDDPVPWLLTAAKQLENAQALFDVDVPEAGNPAKQLARRLHGVLPVLCSGDGLTRVVALRWKGQLNENAETLALQSVLPEMNHNEIMAWTTLPEVRRLVRVFFLRDPDDAPAVQKRMQVTQELLAGRVQGMETIDADTGNPLERMLLGAHRCDFASVYVAFLYGVDPTPVEQINQLKERLATG